MDQKVFRRKNINQFNNSDHDDTLNINCRLANIHVTSSSCSIDVYDARRGSINHLSPLGQKSFDHKSQLKRSLSQSTDDYKRERIDLQQQDANRKLSICIKEVADSRDPEDDKHCESRLDIDERTAAISTFSLSSFPSRRSHHHQDVFTTPKSSRLTIEVGPCESPVENDGHLWGSMHCLKRANPIYESDVDHEERAECTYENAVRKRLCSSNRVTTTVYWHDELKTTDE